jgi:hypothetical protein
MGGLEIENPPLSGFAVSISHSMEYFFQRFPKKASGFIADSNQYLPKSFCNKFFVLCIFCVGQYSLR